MTWETVIKVQHVNKKARIYMDPAESTQVSKDIRGMAITIRKMYAKSHFSGEYSYREPAIHYIHLNHEKETFPLTSAFLLLLEKFNVIILSVTTKEIS